MDLSWQKQVCVIPFFSIGFQLPTNLPTAVFACCYFHRTAFAFSEAVPKVQMKSWMIWFQTLIYSSRSHSALARCSWGWADLPASIIVFKALRIAHSACVRAFGTRVKGHWGGKESEQMSARIVVQLKWHTSQAERWTGGRTGCSYWHDSDCSFAEVTSHAHTGRVCVCACVSVSIWVTAGVLPTRWSVSGCYSDFVATTNKCARQNLQMHREEKALWGMKRFILRLHSSQVTFSYLEPQVTHCLSCCLCVNFSELWDGGDGVGAVHCHTAESKSLFSFLFYLFFLPLFSLRSVLQNISHLQWDVCVLCCTCNIVKTAILCKSLLFFWSSYISFQNIVSTPVSRTPVSSPGCSAFSLEGSALNCSYL